MEWTVGEVAAHVLTVVRRYRPEPRRASTVPALRGLNHAEVADVGDASPAAIAEMIDADLDAMAAIAPLVPLDMERPFHLGLTVTISAGWANLVSECFVHGADIAGAVGRRWDWDDAAFEGIWRQLTGALSGWLRPQAAHLDEVWDIELSFGTVRLWIHEGVVTVDDATRPADRTVHADGAGSLLLQFPFRRRLIEDPDVALLASRFLDI